jgi:hypothetical protein
MSYIVSSSYTVGLYALRSKGGTQYGPNNNKLRIFPFKKNKLRISVMWTKLETSFF